MNMIVSSMFSKEHSQHPPDWQSKDLCLECFVQVLTDAKPLIFKKKALLDCFVVQLEKERECVLRNNGRCLSSTPIIAKLMEEPELSPSLIVLLIDCVANFGADLARLSTKAVLSVLSAVVVDDSSLDLVKELLTQVISKVLEPEQGEAANMLLLMSRILEFYTSCKSFVFGEKQFMQQTVEFINSTDANLSNATVDLLTVLFQDDDPVLDLCSPQMTEIIASMLCYLLRSTDLGISVASVLKLIALIGARKEAKEVFLCKEEQLNLIPSIKTFLASRNSTLQVGVLNILSALLHDSQTDQILVVLNGDITEHLFELLCHNNLRLIELTLFCLHRLISCDAFFCRPYSKFGIQPLLRCIHYLLEKNATVLLVLQGIEIVSALLFKYEEFSVSREVFQLSLGVVGNLINSAFPPLRLAGNALLHTILHKEYIYKPIPVDTILRLLDVMLENFDRIYCSYDVGYSQMLREKHTENVQYMTSVFRVITSCLKLMNRYRGEAICWVSSYSLGDSLSSQSQGSQISPSEQTSATPPPEPRNRFGQEEEGRLLEKLSSFCEQTWWPFLAKHVSAMDCPFWWNAMVDCLISFTDYDTDSVLPRSCLTLVKYNNTFFDTLMKLRLCFADQDLQDGKTSLEMFVSLHILAFLQSLGEEDEGQCLMEALPEVPLDLNQWNAFLYSNVSPAPAKACVLMLRYFMEIGSTEIFADVDGQFLQSLCKIIPTLTQPAPRYLYKVLWFLTARHSPVSNDATTLMLQALEAQMAQDPNVLTAYYTRCPCLLHFALATSECAKLLAPKVLALWLSTACKSEHEIVFPALLTRATDRTLAASLMLILEETSEASSCCLTYLQRFISVLFEEDKTKYKYVITKIGHFFGIFLSRQFGRITGKQDGMDYIRRITFGLKLYNSLTKELECLHPDLLRREIGTNDMEDRNIKLFTTFMTFLPKTLKWFETDCESENEGSKSTDLELFHEASFRCLLHLIASPCGAMDKELIQLIACDESFIAFINKLLHVEILLCIPWVVRLITLVLLWRRAHPQPVVRGRIIMPQALVLTHLSFQQPTACNQAILEFICMSFQVDDQLDMLECQWVREPAQHVLFLKGLMYSLQDLVYKLGQSLGELVWRSYEIWWEYVKRRVETEHEIGQRFRSLLIHPSHSRLFKVLPVQKYDAYDAAHRVKQSIESL